MHSLRNPQHSKMATVRWTGDAGLLICAAPGNRLSERGTFSTGPGGVKDIVI